MDMGKTLRFRNRGSMDRDCAMTLGRSRSWMAVAAPKSTTRPRDFRAILRPPRSDQAGHASQGHEERGRAPAFGRTRAVETGAPRPRRGDRGDVERSQLRPAADSAPEEAQITAQGPDQSNRGSVIPRHHRLIGEAWVKALSTDCR